MRSGRGRTRIIVGSAQDEGLIWTPGLGVGCAETIIHFRELMEAIDNGTHASLNFADGPRAQEMIHAAITSAGSEHWEKVNPFE